MTASAPTRAYSRAGVAINQPDGAKWQRDTDGAIQSNSAPRIENPVRGPIDPSTDHVYREGDAADLAMCLTMFLRSEYAGLGERASVLK